MKIIQKKNKYFFKPRKTTAMIRLDVNNKYKLQMPLSAYPNIIGFIGKPSCGKTSLMLNLLFEKILDKKRISYRGLYSQVLIISPTMNGINDVEFNKIPDENKYDEFNLEVLEDVYERASDLWKNEKKQTLLILDDCGAYLKKIDKKLNEICANHRHSGLSIWCLCQTFKSIPKPVRGWLTHAAIFQPPNLLELQSIFDEILPIKRQLYKHIFDHVFEKKHDYMFVDTSKEYGGSSLFFKRMDQFLIEE